ncbi:MAG TPA: ABC transporter permease, partial [Chloroflexota bacterium]|nr:ABC transporter permease [Chloroflexota bacterium]
RDAAARAGVGMGDAVRILGKTFRVAGLTSGTATITNSVAFVALEDFRGLRGGAPGVSYVLVRARRGAPVEALSDAIQAAHPELTVQTRGRFAAEERRIVADMSTDIIAVMNFVGFVTGLAVLALTVYSAVLARRREYGVLKALGARGAQLYRAVLAQAYVSVALGLAAGVAVTLALALVVPRVTSGLTLAVTPESLAKVAAVSLGIAALAAALSVRQIAGLDPAAVYRGR